MGSLFLSAKPPNPPSQETPAPLNQPVELIPFSSSTPPNHKLQKLPLPQPRASVPNLPSQETPPPLNQTVASIPFSTSSPPHLKLQNPPLPREPKSCRRIRIIGPYTTNSKETDSGATKSATANQTPQKIEGSREVRPSPLPARRKNPIRLKRSSWGEANTERFVGEKKAEELSFKFRLSKREIEEDFEAMGLELPQRLKRRPKRLDALFPRTGLANITADLLKFTSGSRKR